MPNKKKQEYYELNKKKRLEYQKSYYQKNKERIASSRERRKAEDPKWASMQKGYNKEYYLKNKDRIIIKRKARKQALDTRS